MNILRVKFKVYGQDQHADMMIPETDLVECLSNFIAPNLPKNFKTVITIEPVGVMVDYYVADKYKKKDKEKAKAVSAKEVKKEPEHYDTKW